MAKGKKFRRPLSKDGKNFHLKGLEPKLDYNSFKPIFSLKYMPYQGPCCITKCQKADRANILNKILKISQNKWSQIQNFNKKSGFEAIPCSRFTVKLPSIITPEVPSLLVARYDGKGGRFAGFREKDIFHIVLVGDNLYSH